MSPAKPRASLIYNSPLGPVAQSVEQRIENPCVGGSIPPQATIYFLSFFNPRKHCPMTPRTQALKVASLVLACFMVAGCSTLQSAYDTTVDSAKSVAGTVSGWVKPAEKK